MFHIRQLLSATVHNGLILILLLISCCDIIAQAENSETVKQDYRAVKIFSKERSVCASGLLLGSYLITNAHVAHSLCPAKKCYEAEISDPAGHQINLKENDLQLLKSAAVLDLALLNTGPTESLNTIPDWPKLGDQDIAAFSFPRCGNLSVSVGQILGPVSELYLNTNLALKHGSSGGPVFDSQGKLLGIVTEAEDLPQAIKSLILGSSFAQSRIVPAVLLDKLVSQSSDQVFALQADLLVKFYIDRVQNLAGLDRLTESARFLAKAKSLAFENFDKDQSKLILAALSAHPYPFFASLPAENYQHEILQLSLLVSAEKNGLRESVLKSLAPQALEEIESNLAAEKDFIQGLAEQFARQKFKGADIEVAALISICLIYAVLILVLLCFLSAFILCRPNWSFFSKLLFIALSVTACLLLYILVLSSQIKL